MWMKLRCRIENGTIQYHMKRTCLFFLGWDGYVFFLEENVSDVMTLVTPVVLLFSRMCWLRCKWEHSWSCWTCRMLYSEYCLAPKIQTLVVLCKRCPWDSHENDGMDYLIWPSGMDLEGFGCPNAMFWTP